VRLVFSFLIRDFDTCGSSELFGVVDFEAKIQQSIYERAWKNWA